MGRKEATAGRLPLPEIPVLSGIERPLSDWIKPVAGKDLTFQTVGANGESITLVPLFRSQHQRMTVYRDGDTTEEIKQGTTNRN